MCIEWSCFSRTRNSDITISFEGYMHKNEPNEAATDGIGMSRITTFRSTTVVP